MSENLIEVEKSFQRIGQKNPRIKYVGNVTHRGLDRSKSYSSFIESDFNNGINRIIHSFNESWQKELNTQALIQEEHEVLLKDSDAKQLIKSIDAILVNSLQETENTFRNFRTDHNSFVIPSPQINLERLLSQVIEPELPINNRYPDQPDLDSFRPLMKLWQIFFPKIKAQKFEEAYAKYNLAIEKWKEKCKAVDLSNEVLKAEYENKLVEYHSLRSEIRFNNERDTQIWKELHREYLISDPEAIKSYCEWVLTKSEYPDFFSKNFEIEYIPTSKILIVEYFLPDLKSIPTVSEIQFLKNGTVKENHFSELQTSKRFDNTMYSVTLRSLNELFVSDIANAIDSISFNGWVNSINRGTGKRENSCILSIQVKKTEFMEINLAEVEPKKCFKSLKGVGSSDLSGITAIQPILQINKNDRRFVNNRDITESVNNSQNLASMDWEDFEHLIREVFGKEFSINGGEVKVTQASRDGGVDAIAFDPDPIRGGKIVIQAKRYTATVGVSAVRDLFGTVMNEGANKGILVTTADYGSDAYEFVKGKPLTLMNGANLLYLLEKHGYHAKIDLKEARETNPSPYKRY